MRRSVLFVAVICVTTPLSTAHGQSLTESSAAPAPATASSLIGRPDWRQRPTANDVARAYPLRARRQHIDGRATIRCLVKADGRLEQCEVLSESPVDYGFGAAAVELGRRFVMKKTTRDGAPVTGAVVMIPIVFRSPR